MIVVQEILGHVVEFNKELHEYKVDGEVVPSVSTILGATLFKDKYTNVPEWIMERASEFGNGVHKAIETDDTSDLDEIQFDKYDEYLGIILEYDLIPIAHEQIVFYIHEGKVIFIGTLDMLARQLGAFLLIDVKTTYILDYVYLLWQLSMYALAYEQMFNIKIDALMAIWLPKRQKGLFARVDVEGIMTKGRPRKTLDEVLKVVLDYEQTIIK